MGSAQVVTINLNRGLTVAIFILLLAPIDWRTWEAAGVLILLFTLPLIVTTKLVSIVRHVTRGGHVHELDARVFWFGKPQLLLPVINFMLFMCSLVFASMVRTGIISTSILNLFEYETLYTCKGCIWTASDHHECDIYHLAMLESQTCCLVFYRSSLPGNLGSFPASSMGILLQGVSVFLTGHGWSCWS